MDIKQEITAVKEELLALRRDFHQHPELGFAEFRTAGIVADYLRGCGLEVKEKVARTGVVGLLRGEKPGKTVMLRADMDALPVQELNDLPYKSVEEGKMHACGHDGHTAMLLAAARILAGKKASIRGNIKFVFEPNEEKAAARMMIAEGVLEDPAVDAAFATHLWTPITSGKIAVSPGAVMGGLYEFVLKIKGKGGHTSAPHYSIDPILAASDIIQTAQVIQSREIDPQKATVIMFGQISGGTTTNIIPEEVELKGTIRYLYQGGDESEEKPHRRFERIVSNVCRTHRADYELDYIVSSPPVYNQPDLVGLIRETAREVTGNSSRVIDYSCLAGEDFSEFTLEVPSVFYFIGTGNKEKGTDYPHHHPRFNIDEDTLLTGVEMHVRSALAYLNGRD